MKFKEILTVPRLMMLGGSIWLIIVAILSHFGVMQYKGMQSYYVILLSVIYILIALSLNSSEMWSFVWMAVVLFASAWNLSDFFINAYKNKEIAFDTPTIVLIVPQIVSMTGIILWGLPSIKALIGK